MRASMYFKLIHPIAGDGGNQLAFQQFSDFMIPRGMTVREHWDPLKARGESIAHAYEGNFWGLCEVFSQRMGWLMDFKRAFPQAANRPRSVSIEIECDCPVAFTRSGHMPIRQSLERRNWSSRLVRAERLPVLHFNFELEKGKLVLQLGDFEYWDNAQATLRQLVWQIMWGFTALDDIEWMRHKLNCKYLLAAEKDPDGMDARHGAIRHADRAALMVKRMLDWRT